MAMVSPVVTAAARRQLRGQPPSSSQRSAAEIAAEFRKRMNDGGDPFSPAPARGALPLGDISLQVDADDTIVRSPSVEPPAIPTNDVVVMRTRTPGYVPLSTQEGDNRVGIGIKFYPNKIGDHVVTYILPGGPADATGKLHAGQVIVAVDGVLVRGMASEAVKFLIIGRENSSVTITVRKAGPFSPPPILQASPSPKTSNGPHASHFDAAFPLNATGTGFPQPDFASHEPQREHPFVKAGVGIRFGVDKDMKVQIIDLFQGSPAQTSGQLDVGDILVSIDGVLVSGLSSQEINSLIVGPPGTTVTLEVRRGDMIHTARIQRRANATPTSTPSRGTEEAQQSRIRRGGFTPPGDARPLVPSAAAEVSTVENVNGSIQPAAPAPTPAPTPAPASASMAAQPNATVNMTLTPGKAAHMAKAGAPPPLPTVHGEDPAAKPPSSAGAAPAQTKRLEAIEKVQKEILMRIEAMEKSQKTQGDVIMQQQNALRLMQESQKDAQKCSCVVS